jgi:UDP-N-acetylmuramate dehydrogenase
MGCVFKNPPNGAAGKYIEGAGLKGLRIGGAKISEKHANFIINDLGATSADICALITLMKNAVLAQYNIRLEEEIRYIQ